MSVTARADALPESATRHPMLLPVLMLCASLTVMSGATIAPAMPSLRDHFADLDDVDYLVRLILTVPGLAIAAAAPFAGIAADRVGRRKLLMVGIAAYVVAGSSGLWADSVTGILIGRVCLGVAVACIMTASTALLTDHFIGPERDRVMGIQSAFMGVGGIVFVLAGSLLADLSWRAPFAVYLAPLLLLPLVPFFVAKPPENAVEPGAADGRVPWGHVALMYVLGFVTMIVFYNVPAQLPFYARELGAEAQATGGLAIVVGQAAAVVASSSFGRIRARLGHWSIMALGFGLIGAGYVTLSLATSLPMLFATMPVIGFGLGLNFPNLTTWMMGRVPAHFRGRAAGGLSSVVFLGQFASPLVSQPIADAYDLSTAYLVAGLFCLVAVVAPALIISARGRTQTT